MVFYERALFNHILSSQHPTVPGFVYFTPIRPCHYRVYSRPQNNFWCCVGSGMENHSKYGCFIYAHSSDSLYVNLFIASQVSWKAKGLHAGEGRWVHIPNGPLFPLNQAPLLVAEDLKTLAGRVKPVQGKAMTFTLPGVVRPSQYEGLELIPFFRVNDSRYMLYWRLATGQQYNQVVQQLKAEEQTKLALEQSTLDRVYAGQQQPEVDHAYQGEKSEAGQSQGRQWRDSAAWFSYVLKAQAGASVDLVLTYSGQDSDRRFDVLVNDVRVATVRVDRAGRDDFVTCRYHVPAEVLKQGQAQSLTVKFRALPGGRTARICEVRLVETQ